MKKKTLDFKNALNIKHHIEKFKLARRWGDRNLDNGHVIMDALEIECLYFQQSIFIEESADILAKLKRIGFKPLVGFPDESLYDNFSSIMYNEKHNVALSLYKPENEDAIYTAYDITKEAKVTDLSELAVFLAAIKVLMNRDLAD